MFRSQHKRNQVKDHKDTVKKLTECNNYAIQANFAAKSTENWFVDGLIKFEEPVSGLAEMSFNSVSYSVKTN